MVLVELAVGDAYGAGFEHADAEFVAAHHTLAGYVQHPRHVDLRPGRYTDDTQMTLALAELLCDGGPWTPRRLADKFVEVYHRDQRPGYSRRMHTGLHAAQTGARLLALLDRDSERSGAAMRVSPVGLLDDLDQVRHYAEVQARVTHDTEAAVEAAQAAALATHYCHHRLGPLGELPRWLDERLPGDWRTPWQGPVGPRGVDAVRAAITALTSSAGLSAVLRAAVAYTGDVDTVAAIALAAGSRCPALRPDLPERLVHDLENGRYGRDYLRELDHRLLTRDRAA